MGHTIPKVLVVAALGILSWTLVEYTLHRFLFHIDTRVIGGNTAHYLLHGCHNKHPMDGLRLVFPPAATAVLLFPFWNFIKLISTPTTAPALFGGGLLGYVMYDVTHYYVHIIWWWSCIKWVFLLIMSILFIIKSIIEVHLIHVVLVFHMIRLLEILIRWLVT
ncbi:fatty acid 2-hydroxylase 1 [Phtheirospermum japonicum]|uniref:Fatty acid 2-hydroxylase 1 n=1 Tax=Phtheirospermum japonicum TaxID=374723 RepID=A0A830BFI5_9LAMI|nr:fatty acid 2-hydroxylase 1 [Phtheirospermum japonicum]